MVGVKRRQNLKKGNELNEKRTGRSSEKDIGRRSRVERGRERRKRKREERKRKANTSYPTCLAYLTLLRSPLFRERLRDPLFAKDLERLGLRHHETWYVCFFLFFLLSSLFFLHFVFSMSLKSLTIHP